MAEIIQPIPLLEHRVEEEVTLLYPRTHHRMEPLDQVKEIVAEMHLQWTRSIINHSMVVAVVLVVLVVTTVALADNILL